MTPPNYESFEEKSEVFKELQKKGLEDELFKRLNPALIDRRKYFG